MTAEGQNKFAVLTPVLKVDGRDYLLETPQMGAVPQRILKAPVATLAEEQPRITAALDFLFQVYSSCTGETGLPVRVEF